MEVQEASRAARPLRTWTVVTALYAVAIVAATWPFARTFASKIPSTVDPLQHLWVMRWYRSCLLEGRSPLICPGLQYPVGAPIGNFSPLHLQSLLFCAASLFSGNDALCYNVVWFAGLLMTGVGTFALVRSVVGDAEGAFLAGLLAMLSGPVLHHSHAHTELIYAGGFPLFLLAWIRFVDRPGPGRLTLAVGGFALVTMCAAYFMVIATFPAALYVLWSGLSRPRGERAAWFGRRFWWLGGFVAGCLPVLAILFLGPLTEAWRGEGGGPPRRQFDTYHANWWGYLLPHPAHYFSRILPFDPYASGGSNGEDVAYLGLVTLLLVHRAWFGKDRFRGSGYWWAAAGLAFVLSLGSYLPYGAHRIPLPAGWLRDWDGFVPFRLIRSPARFKFFVAIAAALLAGAAWADLRGRIGRRWLRRLATGAIVALAVVDLAHVPYHAEPIPEAPAAYAWLLDRDPGAAWVDVPQMNSADAHVLNARYTYWQSIHRGRTTAGYSGRQNHPFDDLASWGSPFLGELLAGTDDPAAGLSDRFRVVHGVDYLDYARLYLDRLGLRYVVLHREASAALGLPLDRVAALLEHARIYDDGSVAIYDRERFEGHGTAVPYCEDAWGGLALLPRDGFVRLPGPEAAIVLDNPDPGVPLVLAVRARTLDRPRRVRLMAGPIEIARWEVGAEAPGLFLSPPFRLPAGSHRLRLETHGATPTDRAARLFETAHAPIAMAVSAVSLRPATPEERAAGVLAVVPSDGVAVRR